MVETIQEKQKTVANPKEAKPPKGASFIFLLLIGIGVILVVSQYKGRDFIVEDENGNVQLSEERERKLQQKLEELDEAEQYALRAAKNRDYPCYHCVDKVDIFLYTGEIWKYGVTTKGENGRYSADYLKANNLIYQRQFVGELGACYKEEQRKIYRYAILPENLKRDVPLIRPPGNKIDN